MKSMNIVLFGSMLRQLMEQLRPLTVKILEFLFIFSYIIFCLPVQENHKYYLVWAHVVSDHGEATALNREYLGIIFCFSLFITILYLPVHEKYKHYLV